MYYPITATQACDGRFTHTAITVAIGDVIDGWRITGAPQHLSFDAVAIAWMTHSAGGVGDLLRVNELCGGHVFRPFSDPVNPASPYYNRWVFPVEPA